MSRELASVQKELSMITDATAIFYDIKAMCFSFETKHNGKQYSPAIRKLYYALLVDQIPPATIQTTIKSVLKCFLPGLDVDNLQVPKERCAAK